MDGCVCKLGGNDDLNYLFNSIRTPALINMAGRMAFVGLTVVDAMEASGVDQDGLLMEETQAQLLASDIFGDQFTLCLDVTFKELVVEDHFKT